MVPGHSAVFFHGPTEIAALYPTEIRFVFCERCTCHSEPRSIIYT